MPDSIIFPPSPTRDAGIDRKWRAIGERYADVLKAERTHGEISEQVDQATGRWLDAECSIMDVKGTDAALLVMKLELVLNSGGFSSRSDGDFVSGGLRGMIKELRTALGEAAPVPYSTLVKADGA